MNLLRKKIKTIVYKISRPIPTFKFQLKNYYNSIIPLHLYTCWHTKDLSQLMRDNYNFLVESNPQITCHLYDENDCREFIKNNFHEDVDVLNAFNNIIPSAYWL